MASIGAVPATLTRTRRQAHGSSYAEPAALSAANALNGSPIVSMGSQEMRCLHCSNHNLKDYPSHARVGYGRCMAANLERDGAVFMSVYADVDCNKFRSAKEMVIIKREEWHESRKSRR